MLRRRIPWNEIERARHDSRTPVAPGVIIARSLIQGLARSRGAALVQPTGAYDRAAIMAYAAEAARAHQRRTGVVWSAAMSVGLTAAWQAAKAARLAAAH